MSDILSTLAKQIEGLSGNALCSIMLLDASQTKLYLGAAPSFPQAYLDCIADGVPIGPKGGTCGAAAYYGEPVGSFDIAEDPLWEPCRDVMISCGFRSSWSSPIKDSNGKVIGTFGMVYPIPYALSEHDQQLIHVSSHLAGIAIERQWAEAKLKVLNAKLEQEVQQRTAQLCQALSFEATLKRITDKVRDSLDENQILQTTVVELAQIPGVCCCNAGIYSPDHTISTVSYEYSTLEGLSAIGKMIDIGNAPDLYQDIYRKYLLRGEYLQFSPIATYVPHGWVVKGLTILACPIVGSSGVLGDLWLFKPTGTVFDEQEVRLVQQVTNQCAIALRQARLYQASQSQVQQLEQINQLKDDFLSTVSHELRTPITNMRLAIQMAQLVPPGEKQQRYFGILERECKRESDLVNDLLDLQQLDIAPGSRDLSDRLCIQTWIPALIEQFQTRVQAQQQFLTVQLADNLPPLLTHRHSFERIISELLNNACKYTHRGGEIALEVCSTPEGQGGQARITFIIRNQATIPPEELPKIFQKFYRVPHSDPWKQGGTGLGLALVQKLVEQLQGTITVNSEKGWTTFVVQL